MSEPIYLCCGEEPRESESPSNTQLVQVIPGILKPAPCWSAVAVINLKIQNLRLDDYKGKYLILLFYPYDFTFLCPTELIQFSDRAQEFRDLAAEVVAVSTDSYYSHLAWIMTPRKQGGLGEMDIPILSDKNHEISRKYGVLDEKKGIPFKGVFIIDQKQVIRHIAISEILLSRSVDEVLRILQACKFIDDYGDSCPKGPREKVPGVDEIPNYFSCV